MLGIRSGCPRPGLRVVCMLLVAAALAGCTSEGGPRGKQAPSRPALTGELYHGPPARGAATPLGMKWDWPRVDAYGPYLRSLSGSATFYQFAWCEIEPKPGQRNWSSVDAVVRASNKLGYPLFLKLRVGSCWATGGRGGHERGTTRTKTASAMPVDLTAYEGFVRAAAARYSGQGVSTWGIENEVNAPTFWDGTPADYQRLVTIAAGVLRRVNPRARVLDAGLSSTAYGVGIASRLLDTGSADAAVAAYGRYYARRFATRSADFPAVTDTSELQSALQGEQPRRNLAFLAATFDLARRHVVDAEQIHFYESWDNVPALVDYLRASLPPDFPVEAWELGQFWPGGPPDDALRAGEMAKAVVLLLGAGVRRVIWLPLAFNAGGRQPAEIRFGLLDPAGRTRPAGRTFATLALAARGAAWHPLEVRGASGLAFSKPGRTVLVIWGTSAAKLRPAPGVPVRVETATGELVRLPPTGASLATLPIVVTVSAGLSEATALVSGVS